ncbi:MAG: hypothetical protein QXS02_04805 [Candidatus Thermoplasmatota archaeon]
MIKIKANRKFINDKTAAVGTIAMAIVVAITISISMLIIYSILGSLNIPSLDTQLQQALGKGSSFTPVANGTNALLGGLGVFYQLAPLYLIVLIAVAIIGVVMGLMIVRRRQ